MKDMNEIISLKLCKQDKDFLKKEAKKERLTLSAYVRTKMLSGYEATIVEDFQ